MQKALIFDAAPTRFPLWSPSATVNTLLEASLCKIKPVRRLKALPDPIDRISTVDYDSAFSVFPAEACETIGGEACDANIYPEAKLKPDPETRTVKTGSEPIDRDYLDYNEPKTVFPEEACDDLGGEFCDPEYRK